jgi:TonB-linked SusC/RagA family outer membrane protein
MKFITTYKLNLLAFFIIINVTSRISVSQVINHDSVDVGMKQDSVNEKQIIAYGIQPSWMVSGAVSAVKGSELEKTFTTNLANTLYGRLPGLTVMDGSAEPGNDNPSLFSRGVSTFGPGTGPLILVDGFESSFEDLRPEQVASVVLLKDAAATAMFGSRGANGVLLVTTKRGAEGPLKISVSTQQGFQSALQLPDFLGSYQYAQLYNEALNNDGQPDYYSPQDLAAYKSGNDPYMHPDVNWYGVVLRKLAPISNYNLNFEGGSQDVRYFVSLNAIKSNGLYKKTAGLSDNSDNATYVRYNLQSNVDINITKRLTMALNLRGSIENRTNPGGDSTALVFNEMATIPPNAFPVYNPNGSFGGTQLYSNPLGDLLESGLYTSKSKTFQTIFKLTEQLDMIAKGLSASVAYSFNSFSTSYFNKTREYAKYSLSEDAMGNIVYNQIGQNTSLAGEISQGNEYRNSSLQAFVNYSHTSDNNTIDGVVMFNWENYIQSNVSYDQKHIGVGGRLTYTNRHKYIGEFSFGYDGSENFPKGKRFGFFPAISAGWIVSNEAFLKDNDILKYLKIKASYGLVGNDNIGGQHFMYYQNYGGAAGYNFGTDNSIYGGLSEGVWANSDVTWEKAKILNVGLEANVLKRISISFDVFNEDRYDILTQPFDEIPRFVGVTLPALNVGKVNNKGLEATIRYSSGQGKDFTWFAEADLWYAKNKIVYISEPIQLYDYLYRSGHPVGQPFMLEAAGFFKDQNDIKTGVQQTFASIQPGDIKYKDQNGDNIIDQNDIYPVGKPSLPQLTFGLHIGLQYKGFDIDALLQGITDCSIYLSGNYYWAFQNNAKISTFALNRWTAETAETADYPRLSANNNLNNFRPSSFWLRDGSYVKLRSLELGYSLPEKTIKKLGMSSVRFFANGTNLFSWDAFHIVNPEYITGYPAFRTVSIGISLGL